MITRKNEKLSLEYQNFSLSNVIFKMQSLGILTFSLECLTFSSLVKTLENEVIELYTCYNH